MSGLAILWVGLIAAAAIVLWLALRWWVDKRIDALGRFLERGRFGRGGGQLVRILRVLTEGPVLLALVGGPAALWILHILGQDVSPVLGVLADLGEEAAVALGQHAGPVLAILIVAFVATVLVRRAGPGLVRELVREEEASTDPTEAQERASTLSAVLTTALTVIIWVAAALSVLSEMDVQIVPLLAGLGIAGIAIGFGAQSLVRDVIAGFFILAENQFTQNDVVEIGGKTGVVEKVNLRRTVLRDLDGVVHAVPNGEVTMTSNYTKLWSRIHLDVLVAYKEDLEHCIRILNEIGQDMAEEEYWGDRIVDPPQVLRVNAFRESGVEIKILGICRPMTQWEIMGEMRLRIKQRFDEEGVEIPLPHRTVYWGTGAHPRLGAQGAGASWSTADLAVSEQATPEQREAALREMRIAAEAANEARQEDSERGRRRRPDRQRTPEQEEEDEAIRQQARRALRAEYSDQDDPG